MTVVIACLRVRQWAAIIGDHGRCMKKDIRARTRCRIRSRVDRGFRALGHLLSGQEDAKSYRRSFGSERRRKGHAKVPRLRFAPSRLTMTAWHAPGCSEAPEAQCSPSSR